MASREGAGKMQHSSSTHNKAEQMMTVICLRIMIMLMIRLRTKREFDCCGNYIAFSNQQTQHANVKSHRLTATTVPTLEYKCHLWNQPQKKTLTAVQFLPFSTPCPLWNTQKLASAFCSLIQEQHLLEIYHKHQHHTDQSKATLKTQLTPASPASCSLTTNDERLKR